MARTESPLTKRGVELIRAGRTLRETADLLGLAPSTLVRACQRAGLTLPRGRPRLSARTESPLTKRGVELIRAGRTLRETADLLGLSPSTLVLACQRAGLTLPRGRPRLPTREPREA